MSQNVLDTKNPYESAWMYQNKMIAIDQQIGDLNVQKEELQIHYDRSIAQGENAGKTKIGEYSLIVETKTFERRILKMEAIRQLKPEILTTVGTFPAEFATKYLTEKQKLRLTSDPDFEKNYKLGLGELDRAVGGKKHAAPYVDIEISAKETKRISRIETPIIEV